MDEKELIESTLDSWDEIMKKANESGEFTNGEIVSLCWAKVLLEAQLE